MAEDEIQEKIDHDIDEAVRLVYTGDDSFILANLSLIATHAHRSGFCRGVAEITGLPFDIDQLRAMMTEQGSVH